MIIEANDTATDATPLERLMAGHGPGDRVNLSQLHRASGRSSRFGPRRWVRFADATRTAIEALLSDSGHRQAADLVAAVDFRLWVASGIDAQSGDVASDIEAARVYHQWLARVDVEPLTDADVIDEADEGVYRTAFTIGETVSETPANTVSFADVIRAAVDLQRQRAAEAYDADGKCYVVYMSDLIVTRDRKVVAVVSVTADGSASARWL